MWYTWSYQRLKDCFRCVWVIQESPIDSSTIIIIPFVTVTFIFDSKVNAILRQIIWGTKNFDANMAWIVIIGSYLHFNAAFFTLNGSNGVITYLADLRGPAGVVNNADGILCV